MQRERDATYLKSMHTSNDVVILHGIQTVRKDQIERILECQQLLFTSQQEASIQELDIDLQQEQLLPKRFSAISRIFTL
jgi:hypothetical protein